MEKKVNTRLTPQEQQYIKERLYNDYANFFEDNGISSKRIKDAEICDLAEFLITMNPEKYAKTIGNETNYRNSEELQRIYVIRNKVPGKKDDNKAVLINTNEKGKMPQGEFGVYDFERNSFQMSGKVKDEVVKYLGIGALPISKQDEMINELFYKKLNLNELTIMDKLATMDLSKIINQNIPKEEVKKLRDKYIDGENKENGITKEARENIENNKDEQSEQEDKKDSKDSLASPEMLKQAYILGYTKVKGVMVAKAPEAADKMEAPGINRNAGNVTILRFSNGDMGTDKYLVFQGDRLAVPGNKDDEIDKLLGKTMQHYKDGTLIKPLEIEDEEQYLKYHEDGVIIHIKFKEGKDLSVEDLEKYKKEFKENMEEYSRKLDEIENDPLKTDAQRDEAYIAANEYFNSQNRESAREYNINFDDMEEVNLATDERTQEQVDKETDDEEIGAWEVPGKRER